MVAGISLIASRGMFEEASAGRTSFVGIPNLFMGQPMGTPLACRRRDSRNVGDACSYERVFLTIEGKKEAGPLEMRGPALN
jgi:hypothetical protein